MCFNIIKNVKNKLWIFCNVRNIVLEYKRLCNGLFWIYIYVDLVRKKLGVRICNECVVMIYLGWVVVSGLNFSEDFGYFRIWD